MICSFTLYLKPLEIGNKIKKFRNYDDFVVFLKNNNFSKEELKKIICSNFLTKDKFIEDKKYSIKISSIDESIIIKLFRIFLLTKLEKSLIKLNDTDFIVINIYTNNRYCKQLDENFDFKISNIINLKILTPLFFKVGENFISTVDPKYLIRNIEKKLSQSSIKNWEKYILDIKTLDEIVILEENIKNIKLNNLFEGITGEVKYLVKAEREELLKLKFLFEFAFFSGIGYKTEKGYGQVEVI